MGYVPAPPPSPHLNVDRHGLPRDYATYEFLMYGKEIDDLSPERLAFLTENTADHALPPADESLIDEVIV